MTFSLKFLQALNQLYHANSVRGTTKVSEYVLETGKVFSAEFAYGFYFVN